MDTAPLIYFIEGHSAYQNRLLELFGFADRGEFSFVSSTLTLLEVLVKPIKEGQKEIVELYSEYLTSAKGIDLFDIDINTARTAAHLRAKYNIRTPDSIQIAMAIVLGADFFLTNDNRLSLITEVKVITLPDLE